MAFVDSDVAASDSTECFHRAYPVAGVHRASAGGSFGVVERSAVPWESDDEHSPGGDGVAEVGALAVEAEDAIL